MTAEPAINPVGPQTHEMRLATAMTGGVSLAIWMGGVARELNLLQRASNQRKGRDDLEAISATALPNANVEAIYLRLLNLLDTTVDVDILAGTSAGGINAALLGMARVNDLDLADLRDMWLELGALEDLLRDPAEDAPPSLLQGDGKLLDGLQNALTKLWTAPPEGRPLPTTRVHLTTTLLAGEAGRFTDAYGTLVQDVDHRGMFTFDESQLSKSTAPAALATAGRSTASFPFAFEPGFVSRTAAGERPAMEDYANVTRAHWVSDGGLLMNRPIQPMLQEVFDRPADRQVRRVLLYVIPSAGDQPDQYATPKEAKLSEPLSFSDALLGDVKAVMRQSISSDLKAIRDHNDRVDSLCDTRLRMAELGVRLTDGSAALPGMRLTDKTMFEDYRVRQSEWFVRPVIAALMREIGARSSDELPPAWERELAPGSEIEARCRTKAAKAIMAGWSMPGGDPDANVPWFAPLSQFGLATFDGAKATAIQMFRSAFALAATEKQRVKLGDILHRVHEAIAKVDPASASPNVKRFDRPRVRDIVRREVTLLCAPGATPAPLAQAAAAIAIAYERELHARAADLDAAWETLAAALLNAKALFEELVHSSSQPSTQTIAQTRRDRLSRQRASAELRTYTDFLYTGHSDAIAARLFDLHVATRSVLPVSVEVEQPVELVQLSADSRTLLSSRATAQAKLTGMQLHHFGAFYKSSWRANDWTWGRIDGAGWLVHLLLDPRRIETVTPPGSERAKGFFKSLRAAIGAAEATTSEERAQHATVLKELAFLDGATRGASLPETAQWVAREVQRWIAAEELPVIAQEMIANPSRNIEPWPAKVLAQAGPIEAAQAALLVGSWRRAGIGRRRPPEVLIKALTDRPAPEGPVNVAMGDLLASCPVPDHKLEQQFGDPLMTRTITKTAAVAGAILNAKPPPIAVLKAPLAALRTITMAAYRAASAAKGVATPLLALGGGAMVLGVILLLTDNALFGLGGAAAIAIGLMLVTVVTWSPRWKKIVMGAAAALVLGGMVAAVAQRKWLFGDGTRTQKECTPEAIGWFGCEALPWLASPWWHVLVAAAGFSVLALALGAIGRALTPKEADETPAPTAPAA